MTTSRSEAPRKDTLLADHGPAYRQAFASQVLLNDLFTKKHGPRPLRMNGRILRNERSGAIHEIRTTPTPPDPEGAYKVDAEYSERVCLVE